MYEKWFERKRIILPHYKTTIKLGKKKVNRVCFDHGRHIVINPHFITWTKLLWLFTWYIIQEGWDFVTVFSQSIARRRWNDPNLSNGIYDPRQGLTGIQLERHVYTWRLESYGGRIGNNGQVPLVRQHQIWSLPSEKILFHRCRAISWDPANHGGWSHHHSGARKPHCNEGICIGCR